MAISASNTRRDPVHTLFLTGSRADLEELDRVVREAIAMGASSTEHPSITQGTQVHVELDDHGDASRFDS